MTKTGLVVGFAVLVCAVSLAELLCPFTKVEESFNMQAMHDFFFAPRVDAFDHHTFPGVVPRTFTGAWIVSVLTLMPLALVVEPLWPVVASRGSTAEAWTRAHAPQLSHACRGVLGCLVLWSLWSVASALSETSAHTERRRRSNATLRDEEESHGAAEVGGARKKKTRRPAAASASHPLRTSSPAPVFFCLLCASQFHLIFYATRALPNTFGLALCTGALAQTLRGHERMGIALLSIAAALFRCDVLALLAPYGLYVTMRAAVTVSSSSPEVASPTRAPSLGARFLWQLAVGVLVGLLSVSTSVALTALGLDSLLWQRWLWPEGVVLLFNTAENKSVEWGVSPAHWYWSHALPRALLAAYPALLCLGLMALWDLMTTTVRALARTCRRTTLQQMPQPVHTHQQRCSAESNSFVLYIFRSAWCVAHRYQCVLVSALTFIALYSALPHKELRFILVVFPWLLAPVAVWMAELWAWSPPPSAPPARSGIAVGHSVVHVLARFAIGIAVLLAFLSCGVSVAVSAANYPGGIALRRLEAIIAADAETDRTVNTRSASVTVFLDAYAAMAGINRFQKTFIAGHIPLASLADHEPTPERGEAAKHDQTASTQLSPRPLWTRWKTLVMLPVEALVWRTQTCLGPVTHAAHLAVDTIRGVLRDRAQANLTGGAVSQVGGARRDDTDRASQCAYRFSTESPTVSSSSSSSAVRQPSSGYVRYVKDPTLFLTEEEVRAMHVAARTGRAGPSSTNADPIRDRDTSRVHRVPDDTLTAVYKADGIDYALVRAAQWELHLVDHAVFELLFIQRDDTRLVLSSLKDAASTCVRGTRIKACSETVRRAVTDMLYMMRKSLGVDVDDGQDVSQEAVTDAQRGGVRMERRRGMALAAEAVSADEREGAYLLALRRRV